MDALKGDLHIWEQVLYIVCIYKWTRLHMHNYRKESLDYVHDWHLALSFIVITWSNPRGQKHVLYAYNLPRYCNICFTPLHSVGPYFSASFLGYGSARYWYIGMNIRRMQNWGLQGSLSPSHGCPLALYLSLVFISYKHSWTEPSFSFIHSFSHSFSRSFSIVTHFHNVQIFSSCAARFSFPIRG